MPIDWLKLATLSGGMSMVIERVRLRDPSGDVVLEGQFELPPLAQLAADDQVFVAAFVRSHGSIKQMERFFGVSYPTIKNRLNRIGSQLPLAEIAPEEATESAPADELLSQLERGEMSVRDVLNAFKTRSGSRT